jgi:hypothetical protein
VLAACPCPACARSGLDGLRAGGLAGFANRATHNLWTLLHEAEQIEAHRAAGAYAAWYRQHLDNSIYRPLIAQLVDSPLQYSLQSPGQEPIWTVANPAAT